MPEVCIYDLKFSIPVSYYSTLLTHAHTETHTQTEIERERMRERERMVHLGTNLATSRFFPPKLPGSFPGFNRDKSVVQKHRLELALNLDTE